nr:hypothetical protein [Tanacetum cinerariifolium]
MGKQVDAIYIYDDDPKDDAFFVSDYEYIAFSISDYQNDAYSVGDYEDNAFFVIGYEYDESEVDDDTYVMCVLPNVHPSTLNVSSPWESSDYQNDAYSVGDYEDNAFFVIGYEDDESEVDDDTYVMCVLPNVHPSTLNEDRMLCLLGGGLASNVEGRYKRDR